MADTTSRTGRAALGLGTLVFTAGAGLMCAELVGAMTVAPYFGSNVFVWGSMISVFMAALSVGYVLGGAAANRRARVGWLSALAALAGLLVTAVPLVCPPVCRFLIRVDLGPVFNPLRPLAAAGLIYFLPTMCFGMIVPIAVRIASTTLSRVGRVVGRLYALNALGSVCGALGTMFLLVPFFGNRAILLGCGAAIILAAGVCACLQRKTAAGETRMPLAAAAAPAAEPGADGEPAAGLRPLVFVCGMVFMGLEVVGGAEIAPYFGSNIFVWGSVITLFLGALSIGYRLGGWLADRRPAMMTLATVVVAAGLATLFIPILAPWVCGALSGASFAGRFSIPVQALLASVALYLVPTMLFAMVAPFAVRLATQDVNQVGGVAGKLYALSTAGNVVGVLLTTFVLISTVGKTHVLEGAGVLAVLVSVAAVLIHNRAKGEERQPVIVSAILVVVTVLFAWAPKPALVPITSGGEKVIAKVETDDGVPWSLIEITYEDVEGRPIQPYHLLRRIREERESPYHHIAVIERAGITSDVLDGRVLSGNVVTTRRGRKIFVNPQPGVESKRDLRFDQYVESSLILESFDREVDQKRYKAGTTYSDLLHLPFLFGGAVKDVNDVVIVGGGGGVVPMIFAKSYPHLSIDVVEIDPVVVDAAEKWFGLTPGPSLRVHVQDGRMFIHNSKDKYDLIILDAYTAGGRIPFHLTTKEFLSDVRDHLRPRGIALMNVISGVSGPASRLFRAEYKTFTEVFGREHVYVFPKRNAADRPEAATNVILIATGPAHSVRLTPGAIEERARKRVLSGEVRMPTLAGRNGYAANLLRESELKRVKQDDVPVLTDDYAPVDMMTVE